MNAKSKRQNHWEIQDEIVDLVSSGSDKSVKKEDEIINLSGDDTDSDLEIIGNSDRLGVRKIKVFSS